MVKMLCFSLLATLALSACTPGDSGSEDEPARSPFGYEFA